MRVSNNMYTDMLTLLSNATSSEQKTLTEMSTGRSVNKPSDDPIAEATMVKLLAQSDRITQYQSNVSALEQQYNTADSALSSIVTAVQSAITVGTEGATGTVSSDNREALAEEVDSIKSEVLSLANTTYNGVYLFGGSAVTTPFVSDSTTDSGVAYAGNSSPNQVSVTDGVTVDSGVDGSTLFDIGGSNDLFAALTQLSTALRSDDQDAISSAVTTLGSASTAFNNQRARVSSKMTQLDAISTVLTNKATENSSAQDDAVGADIATVASTYVQQETAREALMQAIGKISQTTLIDYLSS